MAITNAQIKSWLQIAHDWLFAFDDIKIHNSLTTFRNRMLAALERDDKSAAGSERTALLRLTGKFQTAKPSAKLEACTIRAECAFVSYMLGEPAKAIEQLKELLKLCSPSENAHLYATTTWMLGCMLWGTGRNADALICWESSIDLYTGLKNRSELYPSDATSRWYAERIDEMQNVLGEALGTAAPPPKHPKDEDFSSTPGSTSPPTGSPYFTEEDILRLFTIDTNVPAGDPRPADEDADAIGYMEVEHVKIKGRLHYIKNLRNHGRIVRYPAGYQYGVIEVHGDSMNAQGIDSGDYVLLRYQNTAENNEIVAAKIHEVDTVATLKRFIKKGGHIILQFQSNSPEHKERDGRDKQIEFTAQDGSLEIIGVALAVFKPV